MVSLRHLALFWLSVGFQIVGALNSAFPYEMVYFYNVYKAEFATQPDPALRKIARGCVHRPNMAPPNTPPGMVEAAFIQSTIDAGVVGICSFKDFMEHVGSNAWRRLNFPTPNAANPTSVVSTLDPDPDRIAAQIRTQNLPVRFTTHNDRLIQGLLQNEPWPNVIREASDVMQTAREAHAASPGTAAAIFEGWISKSVKVLEVVTQFRIGDFARYLVPAMQADVSWTSSPMATHAKINNVGYVDLAGNPTVGNNGAATYEVIDYDQSFADARAAGSPFTRAQKKALLAFNKAYGAGPKPGTPPGPALNAALAAEVHQNVIDRFKFAKELHQAPLEDPHAGCACCVVM